MPGHMMNKMMYVLLNNGQMEGRLWTNARITNKSIDRWMDRLTMTDGWTSG